MPNTAVTFQVKYIAQCIEEIKAELKQDNIAVKANAVAKLSYVIFIGIFMQSVNIIVCLLYSFSAASNDWI